MLKEFIKKVSDWTLQKEEELANECAIPTATIEKQIDTLKKKKVDIEHQLKELDEVITRLEKIKEESMKCEVKK